MSDMLMLAEKKHMTLTGNKKDMTLAGKKKDKKQKAEGLGRRMSLSAQSLASVTGDDGDVKRDEELAYGESTLSFQNVSFSVTDKEGKRKEILAPISGVFTPGTLVALMGPSGCGKSTLLDILAQKKTKKYEGEVHVNGRPRDTLYRRMISYVPQEDVMPEHWTVKEALMFNHRLKNTLPQGVSHEMLVCPIIKDVGLGHVASTKIGGPKLRGLSGGQKRRVTLARGFCASAQILFCDEPTSGLSATDAEVCVKSMRFLAKKFGTIIIVVIHQPRYEVAKLFDHLVMLTSCPGRAVYNGKMKDLGDFCANLGFPVMPYVTPCDHCLDLVTPEMKNNQVAKFVAHFKEHEAPKVAALVDDSVQKPGCTPWEILNKKRDRLLVFGCDLPKVRNSICEVPFGTQLKVVFTRNLRLSFRDKGAVLGLYMVQAIKACVIGVVYLNNAAKAPPLQLGFFMLLSFQVVIDGIGQAFKIVDDRTLMKYEASEGLYNEAAFIISSSITNFFIQLGSLVIFVGVMFCFTGQDWRIFKDVLFWNAIVLFSIMDACYSMVGALAPCGGTAGVMVLPFLLITTVYNGFTTTASTAPAALTWVLDISPVALAMQGIAVALQDLAEGEDQVKWDITIKTFGYKDYFMWSVGICVFLNVVCRVVQVVALMKLNNIQK